MQAACLICVSAVEIFGGWRGCLCCCCSDDDTTKGARSRRFFHLRLHDFDMEGSVMCRLRAAVCGGVGVPTGCEIQPSLRPQREVHAVSDKHKPEGGNPGIELCCPRCVKKMTPTCVSLSLPILRRPANMQTCEWNSLRCNGQL